MFLTEREKEIMRHADDVIQSMDKEIERLKGKISLLEAENVVARNSDTDRPRTDSTS